MRDSSAIAAAAALLVILLNVTGGGIYNQLYNYNTIAMHRIQVARYITITP